MNTNTQKIITGLIAAATIIGGVIIGFKDKDTPKMTYDEAQKLIQVYNHELKQSKDKSFSGVTKDNMIQKLNDKFSNRAVTTEEDLAGEKINPVDYQILRSGLMQKAK